MRDSIIAHLVLYTLRYTVRYTVLAPRGAFQQPTSRCKHRRYCHRFLPLDAYTPRSVQPSPVPSRPVPSSLGQYRSTTTTSTCCTSELFLVQSFGTHVNLDRSSCKMSALFAHGQARVPVRGLVQRSGANKTWNRLCNRVGWSSLVIGRAPLYCTVVWHCLSDRLLV